MAKRSFIRLFELRKGQLDSRVKRDYVRNGIATIPCRVSSYSDLINPYSAPDYETANTEFVEYLETTASVTPPECPLVLNIIGGGLSQEEKETVVETVRDYYAYALGVVEKKEKRHTWTFVLMLLGLAVSGVLLWLTEALAEEPREMVVILFWFMGETLCDYIFLTGHELRQERRLAGRLASIKVVFSESYRAPTYTKQDFDRLYSEIEKDVSQTIEGSE